MKETKRKKIIAKQKKVKIQDLTIKYNQSEVFSE